MARRFTAGNTAGIADLRRRVYDGGGVLQHRVEPSGGCGDHAADLRCVHRVRDGMKIMKSPCKTCRLAAACEKHTSRKCTIWIAWFTHTWDKLCELAKKQWGYWNSEDES